MIPRRAFADNHDVSFFDVGRSGRLDIFFHNSGSIGVTDADNEISFTPITKIALIKLESIIEQPYVRAEQERGANNHKDAPHAPSVFDGNFFQIPNFPRHSPHSWQRNEDVSETP
jgi:hypothetical protein